MLPHFSSFLITHQDTQPSDVGSSCSPPLDILQGATRHQLTQLAARAHQSSHTSLWVLPCSQFCSAGSHHLHLQVRQELCSMAVLHASQPLLILLWKGFSCLQTSIQEFASFTGRHCNVYQSSEEILDFTTVLLP